VLTINNRDNAKTARFNPVQTEKRRGRGRPRKVINHAWLEDATSPQRKITLTRLAKALGVHRHTLRNYLKLYKVYEHFTHISDAELDLMIRIYKNDKPDSGLRYVVGFLKTHGVRVQRCRVKKSIRRVDGLGDVLRRCKKIERRRYSVPRSNHLWHMDGHHKLILWGIVIHGIVDGYCRTVS
jgi:hypothetical protein